MSSIGSRQDEFPSADGDTTEFQWATDAALVQRLTTPVGVTLSGSPLRRGLYRFSRTQGVAVLLDRRIDPEQQLDVTLNQVPLGEALHEIANQGGMVVSQIGPLFYFGPESAAGKLRTLAALTRERLQKIPREAAQRFTRRRKWRWDDLATPRDLLHSLAEEGQFEIEGLDGVPHDLWAAADLPPLSLLDRLTIIAIQFDLTFSIASDGASVRLMPLPKEIAIVRRYPAGPRPVEAAERMAALAPEARVRVSGDELLIKATVEEHARLATSRVPPRMEEGRAAGNVGNTRIERMAVENIPVGAVLKRIASQLHLELRVDDAALERAGISLNKPISIHAERVALDRLLEEVARSAGLEILRSGRILEVRPND